LVVEWRDYAASRLVRSGQGEEMLGVPPGDVLSYQLEGGTRVVIRPSGTEPKLKFYIDHREPVAPDEPLTRAEERSTSEVAVIEQALSSIVATA
jgi:phosphomannomutase